jgi:hypothetical protein
LAQHPNPTVNNIPGALIYEGNGPGRCNCLFTNTYPYAIGPGLVPLYQIDSKTVFAWGSASATRRFLVRLHHQLGPLGVGFNQLTFNNRARLRCSGRHAEQRAGLSIPLTTASLSPGLFPASPTVLGNPNFYTIPTPAGRPGSCSGVSVFSGRW